MPDYCDTHGIRGENLTYSVKNLSLCFREWLDTYNAVDEDINPAQRLCRLMGYKCTADSRGRRRARDDIAATLVAGGMTEDEVYRAPRGVVDTMLALDGSDLRDNLGRPIRAWAGDPVHAHELKMRVGREYAVFTGQNGFKKVIQVVARPPGSKIRLRDFRSWHGDESAKLTALLRESKRRLHGGFACDMVAAEIGHAGQEGWHIDCHFHLIFRADHDTLVEVQEHFNSKGWSFWFDGAPLDQPAEVELPPRALAQYVGKGLGASLLRDDWSPDAVVALRRQTKNISLVRATGRFRAWKSATERQSLVAVEDEDGNVTLTQKRRPAVPSLHRTKLFQSVSAIALRVTKHRFEDGEYRPAILVRGAADVALVRLAEDYDLRHVAPHLYKVNPAIPKKYTPVAPTILTGVPLGDRGPPEDTKIPW